MQLLNTEFTRRQFCFKQIKRIGNVAIYEKWTKGSSKKHYEVIRIRSHNGYDMAGTWIEPAEMYPGDEQWGINGFTINSIEAAEKKFNELVLKEKLSKEKCTTTTSK